MTRHRKPQAPFFIKVLKFSSGERLPILMRRGQGSPLLGPCLYTLFRLRIRGRATETINQALRALGALFASIEAAGIDLVTQEPAALAPTNELSALILNACWQRSANLSNISHAETPSVKR